jgi:diacylglycerol kinase (ATP)
MAPESSSTDSRAPEAQPRRVPGPFVVIANPRAGGGRVAEQLPLIEEGFRAMGVGYRLLPTEGQGHATRLAREALAAGDRLLVAVGGDGTVNEVVNGLIVDDRQVDPTAVLAVISAGSGSDFVRTFGLPEDTERAVARLGRVHVFPIDVGKATFTAPDGTGRSRYFVNMAEIGLGGASAARSRRLSVRLRGSRRFLGYWLAMARYRRAEVHVKAGGKEYHGSVTNVVVANCQYAGQGFRVSPRSFPSDGYLDALLFTGPKSDTFTLLPKMILGEHLPHPNIREFKVKSVEVAAARPLAVAADGEPFGSTPVTFEILPQVLRLQI